jgi:hypothetical protein
VLLLLLRYVVVGVRYGDCCSPCGCWNITIVVHWVLLFLFPLLLALRCSTFVVVVVVVVDFVGCYYVVPVGGDLLLDGVYTLFTFVTPGYCVVTC